VVHEASAAGEVEACDSTTDEVDISFIFLHKLIQQQIRGVLF